MDLTQEFLYVFRFMIFVVPIAFYIHHWYKKRSIFVSTIDKLPGPKKLPILGNALRFIKSPVEIFTQSCKDVIDFGPLFRFWILNQPQILISKAQDVEKILHNIVHHVKSDNYRFLHNWMGLGLLTSRDEKWRLHRKILTPAFHFNILENLFLPIFIKNSLKFVSCLEVEESKGKDGFNIFRYASLCSLDIICESSMGTALNAQNNENSPYVQAVNKINDLLVRRYFNGWLRNDFIFNLSPTKREMDKCLKTLNDFTDKVIDERRKYLKIKQNSIKDGDNVEEIGERRSLAFLDLLLAAEEKGCDHMTPKDIRDQVSTFMFEGHDTVSTAMSWFLFIIGLYPEHQDRIVEELNEVFGESGRAPEISDLANLKYLERCIKESLRLFPSVPFIERGPIEDAQVGKYTIPSGCTLTFNIYVQHRDPEFWPEPEKFDPDRFLPENVKGRHPYAYIPFSAGPRNCIGQKFALMEEKVVISTVLRRYRIEAAHTREEAILQVGMVLRPQNGLRVRIYNRDLYPNLRVFDPSSQVYKQDEHSINLVGA